jgi:diguanylate cyclase (GGDEF)-like protein
MIDRQASILVVGDGEVAERLSRDLGPERLTRFDRPYPALAEFARRPYEALVLAWPMPELPALARAFRRLRGSTRCYAVCTPAGEAELRLAGNGDLDDYFIHPVNRDELERIVAGPRPAEPGPAAPAPAATPPAIGAEDLARLIRAGGTVLGLSETLAEVVGEWTGLEVRWSEQDDAGQALLLMDHDEPRILVAEAGASIEPAVRERIAALQELVGPLAANAHRTESLHRLAITDHLTGAYNRRYFYHFTDEILGRARAERFRVTLLLYDIDDFKRYNDTYGHAVGDEILRETARLMRGVTRDHDVVARIGGDEFAVMFWDAEPPRRPDSQHPASAHELAERFRSALAEYEFDCLGPDAKGTLTISGGLASYPWDGATCRDLLRAADRALRAVKADGKDGIRIVG